MTKKSSHWFEMLLRRKKRMVQNASQMLALSPENRAPIKPLLARLLLYARDPDASNKIVLPKAASKRGKMFGISEALKCARLCAFLTMSKDTAS